MSSPFQLAPMSRLILVFTLALLVLPAALLGAALLVEPRLGVLVVLVVGLYLWIWVRFRPTAFVIHPDMLEVVWPMKHRRIARSGIADVRLISASDLRHEIGWGMRIGAGGLWGAFGWLWTTRRGIVQMYISRTDRFVWIERPGERRWLVTPDRPDEFVQALSRSVANSIPPAR